MQKIAVLQPEMRCLFAKVSINLAQLSKYIQIQSCRLNDSDSNDDNPCNPQNLILNLEQNFRQIQLKCVQYCKRIGKYELENEYHRQQLEQMKIQEQEIYRKYKQMQKQIVGMGKQLSSKKQIIDQIKLLNAMDIQFIPSICIHNGSDSYSQSKDEQFSVQQQQYWYQQQCQSGNKKQKLSTQINSEPINKSQGCHDAIDFGQDFDSGSNSLVLQSGRMQNISQQGGFLDNQNQGCSLNQKQVAKDGQRLVRNLGQQNKSKYNIYQLLQKIEQSGRDQFV